MRNFDVALFHKKYAKVTLSQLNIINLSKNCVLFDIRYLLGYLT